VLRYVPWLNQELSSSTPLVDIYHTSVRLARCRLLPVNSTSVFPECNHEKSNLDSSYTQRCMVGTIHASLHVSLDFDMESMGDMQTPDSPAR